MGPYVAFDIGNVLCHFDIIKFTKFLTDELLITEREAYFFLERLQKHQDIGVTSVASELEFHYKVHGEQLQTIVDCWNSTVTPNHSMMNFLENLRSEGVKVALLSNMGPEHITHLRGTVPEMFKDTIQHISCEVGARKPTKLFFQSFILDNSAFEGCVYIDDIEENLRAGKKYSFTVFGFNLEEHVKLSMSKQKIELDRLRNMIFNLNPNTTGSEIYHG